MCHVLIIEDDAIIAMDLQMMLEAEGATSFAFADSEESAVVAALEQRPGLITSDVNLIDGTGPHAITTIHRRLGDIPVIFVTGRPEQCQPCNPPGRILTKPLDPVKFRQAYHDLVG